MKIIFTAPKTEFVSGVLVRLLVFAAGLLVLFGGIIYLCKFGHNPPNYHVFLKGFSGLHSPYGILMSALSFDARGIIRLGILLLICIPIIRVAVFALTFMLQKDWLYLVVTLIVFCILISSLFGNRL